MSARKPNMSKLRKKLEAPSKKTRRSTDLRRSLGRKSVGDISVSDLAAFEQVPTSSDEESSLHISPDSAVLDHEFAEDPDWHTHLGVKGVVVSEESLIEAYQLERAQNIRNSSEVDGLDLSSFDIRDVHKILQSSVVLDRKAVKSYLKSGSTIIQGDSVFKDSPSENMSLELPQRGPRKLRRVERKDSHSSEVMNKYRKILEDSSTSEEEASDKNSKHSISSNPDGETSLVLPKRKPTNIRTLRRVSSPSSGGVNPFNKVLEDSSSSGEEGEQETSGVKNTASQEDSVFKAPPSVNSSLELPQRGPRKLRRVERKSSNSSEVMNKYRKILEISSTSEEEEVNLSGKSDKNSKHSISSNPDGETSLVLPKRKPTTIRTFRRISSPSSGRVNPFNKVLEDSSSSGEEGEQETSGVKNTASQEDSVFKAPPSVNSSLELPQRGPRKLRRVERKDSNSSEIMNKYRKILEISSTSEEEEVNLSGKSDRNSKHSISSNPDGETSLVLPKRKPTNIRTLRRVSSPSSGGVNPFNKVLEDSSSSGEESAGKRDGKAPELASTRKNSLLSELNIPGKENLPSLEDETQEHIQENFSKTSSSKRCLSNDAVEVSLALENTFDSEANTSLPLGAEAMNIRGVIDHQRKQRLSHCRASGQNQISKPPSEIFEGASLKELHQEGGSNPLNPQGSINASKMSNRSVTTCTMTAPLRVSNVSHHPTVNLIASSNLLLKDTSANNKNISNVSSAVGKSASNLNINGEDGSLSAFPQPGEEEVSITSPSGINSPKSAVLAMRTSQSSRQSRPSRQKNKSVQERVSFDLPRPVSKELIPTDAIDEDSNSCPSEASTLSLPTNISDSVFESAVAAAEERAAEGHDHESNSSSSCLPASNMVENSHGQNETWTENPFVDLGRDSDANRTNSFAAESEPFEEELSEIEADDRTVDNVYQDSDVSDDLVYEENTPSQSPLCMGTKKSSESQGSGLSSKRQWSKLSSGTVRTSEIGSSKPLSCQTEIGFSEPLSAEPRRLVTPSEIIHQPNQSTSRKPSIFSPITRASSPANNTAVQNPTERPKINPAKKKSGLSEIELQKLQSGIQKSMEEIRNKRHASNEKNPQVVAKPKPSAPKEVQNPAAATSKKNYLSKYFGDYKQPRRVKPRPYVTAKMYKFLESKLKPNFGLEARIQAENFVSLMCDLVQSTIKKKSKYHKHVFELRDKMVSLGIIKTQFEYHLFIEDYLPDSFRFKAIPCYGSTKGPKLDVEDIHQNLSVN